MLEDSLDLLVSCELVAFDDGGGEGGAAWGGALFAVLVLDDEVVAVEGENLVGLDVPDEGVAVDGVAVVPGVAVAAPVGGVGEGALVGEGEGELVGPFADVGGLVIVAFDIRNIFAIPKLRKFWNGKMLEDSPNFLVSRTSSQLPSINSE